MMNCRSFFFVISTIGAIYVGFLIRRPVSLLSESSKCPYCYGTDLCEDVFNERITLRYETFYDLFNNLLSVKNTYLADYAGKRVILKKLGHRSELDKIVQVYPVSKDHIVDYINSKSSDRVNSLTTCNPKTTQLFVESLEGRFTAEQLWTIIQINPEPLILSIFESSDRWPVPQLHGACGFLLVEKHCGRTLNYFRTFDWQKRAFLALQLLEAAVNFTLRHRDFRLYLTDISPDNIAVDDDFNLYFIDVENVIVKQKLADNGSVHYSRHFDEESYAYIEGDVCEHEISDHNVYAVCRLLLSQRAPWPMMQHGLLHTPPSTIPSKYKELFGLVEECVDSNDKKNRFYIAEEIIKLLRQVI